MEKNEAERDDMDRARLVSIRGFLVYVARTY